LSSNIFFLSWLDSERGSYQLGYVDGSVDLAERKTDEWVREISKRVESGEIGRSDFGIGSPSFFARNFPDFDTVHGPLIEYFHKLCHVVPKTCWKKCILKKYRSGDELENCVMLNAMRKIFSERIADIIPTHDLGSEVKNPVTDHMKAADWDLFIITTSVLAEGLLDDPIFECWMEYRKGYMLHVHNPSMTGKERKAASEAFRNFGELAEENFPITMMTITTHFVAIEADIQIDFTGPIREAMSSWIERLCGMLVEDIRRRRVCNRPIKTCARAYALRHFLVTHYHEIQSHPTKVKVASSNGVYDESFASKRFWLRRATGSITVRNGSHSEISGRS